MRDKSPKASKPRISIENELTTHFLVSACIIIICLMVLIYWSITSTLRTQSIRYMKDEVFVVQELLNTGSLEVLLRKIRLSSEKEYAKLYLRILDKESRLIAETPEMSRDLPLVLFHPPVPIDSPRLQHYHTIKSAGKNYMIESLWLHMLGEPRIVQMGLDLTNIESILPSYAEKLLWALILGVILSSLAGRYIVRKGLRPLHVLTAQSKLINSENLDKRFHPQHWPAELHSLTIALDEMLDRFQNAFERLRSYSSNLAHELRTPITNLMGEAEIALTKPRSREEYERVIESSLDEYQRLMRVIESLLFLAWADSREVRPKLKTVNLNEEIYNLQDYYSADSQGRGFLIMCDPEATVTADPVLLRRALSNLITNAIKYTPDGKLITIDVAKINSHVEISVSDQGDGIPPEHLERIFDRFYRIPGSDRLNSRGSGLGLAIVKSIMEIHGGSVHVDSAMHKGTKVTLSFPNNQFPAT